MTDSIRTQHGDDERILDLLTERLERPLSQDERAELDELLRARPHWRKTDLDFAAAAIHLALEPSLEPMPEDVKARVIGKLVGEATRPPLRLAPAGAAVQPAVQSQPRASKGAHSPPTLKQNAEGSGAKRRPKPARSPFVVVPWLAAAAALVIAVVGWWPRVMTQPPVGGATGATLADLRLRVAKDPNATVVSWSKTADPLGTQVSGDVVWSNSAQAGVMRFQGLPKNDPQQAQYQLWIFDAERDERYPVDGGVFDVNADGEVLVAITARVPVKKATLFAITLEKPGGVVVSTRERLVALGKVG